MHMVGFGMLLFAIVLITANDIQRFLGGGNFSG